MKHRRNKVKREHSIIENALEWLESLSQLAEVTDIIPGVIDVKHSSERGIVYKYETQTGCKLLLKSNGSIQEAFVVTKNPSRIQEWVNQAFPPESQVTGAAESEKNSKCGLSSKLSEVSAQKEQNPKYKPSGQGCCPQKSSHRKSLKSNYRSEDDVSHYLSDRLDVKTLKALKAFKQSLEDSHRQP